MCQVLHLGYNPIQRSKLREERLETAHGKGAGGAD